MQVKASGRNLPISASKLKSVAEIIRNQDVLKATVALKFTRKKAASLLLQVLNSAIANAKNNYGLEEDNLYVQSLMLGQGPTYKRWRARARGSADEILKRTAHISIVLGERVVTSDTKVQAKLLAKKKKDAAIAQKQAKAEKAPAEKPQDLKTLSQKPKEPGEEDQEKLSRLKQKKVKSEKKQSRGFLNKLFRRKAE